MKKIIVIAIVAIGGISAFGFVLNPSPTTDEKSPIANVKVGAEKSGFTETTSW